MKIIFWTFLSYLILVLILAQISRLSLIGYVKKQLKHIHQDLCANLPNYSHRELTINLRDYSFPIVYTRIYPNSKEKLYLMDDIIKLEKVAGWKIKYKNKKTLELSKNIFTILLNFA